MGMAIRSETEVLPRLPLNLALVHADLYYALKTLKGYPCIIKFSSFKVHVHNFYFTREIILKTLDKRTA